MTLQTALMEVAGVTELAGTESESELESDLLLWIKVPATAPMMTATNTTGETMRIMRCARVLRLNACSSTGSTLP